MTEGILVNNGEGGRWLDPDSFTVKMVGSAVVYGDYMATGSVHIIGMPEATSSMFAVVVPLSEYPVAMDQASWGAWPAQGGNPDIYPCVPYATVHDGYVAIRGTSYNLGKLDIAVYVLSYL